jgi:hypothetical protein
MAMRVPMPSDYWEKTPFDSLSGGFLHHIATIYWREKERERERLFYNVMSKGAFHRI